MKSALLCSFEEYYSEAEIIEEIVETIGPAVPFVT
jgi:hypothetical protein